MAKTRKDDCLFVGQEIEWKTEDKRGDYINVHQTLAIDELQEIHFEKHLKDDIPLVRPCIQHIEVCLNFISAIIFSRCASNLPLVMSEPYVRLSEPLRVSLFV